MSYQVLARRLRPATFSALVGQDHVVRALSHALDHDQLHHAYLFTGTRGVGKTTIARILAKALNCERGVSSTPCGECSICQEVAENRFVDLIEVDAASRTGIDDTRELLENAQYLPTRGRYKVYLVDEVHMLSTPSFNALLKTLEEPPEHVKFLLATTDPKKVPVTVLSRCLQFQLKNISAQKAAAYLNQILTDDSVEFEQGALDVIAKAARGSMRDALSITDQAIAFGQGSLRQADVIDMLGVVGRDEVSALLDALAAQNANAVLAAVAELAERSVDFDALLAEMLAALHQMAVAHATGEPLFQDQQAGDNRAAFFSPDVVQLLYQIALMGYRDLQIAPDPRSGMEMTLLRMLSYAPEALSTSVPPAPQSGGSQGSGMDSAPGAEEKTSAAGGQRAAAEAHITTSQNAAKEQTTSSSRTDSQVPDAEATSVSSAAAQSSMPPTKTQGGDKPAKAARADVTPGSDDWFALSTALELGGVARMIVENSVLVERRDDLLVLCLDQAHDTLLNDGHVLAISRAVTDHLGRTVKCRFSPAASAKKRRPCANSGSVMNGWQPRNGAEQGCAGEYTVDRV